MKRTIETTKDGFFRLWVATIADTKYRYNDQCGFFNKTDAVAYFMGYDENRFQRKMSDEDKERRQELLMKTFMYHDFFKEKGVVRYHMKLLLVKTDKFCGLIRGEHGDEL